MSSTDGRAPFWVEGELTLRVSESDAGPARDVHVLRPFATIGRAEGVDVRIDDRDVSASHAYLHADRRGVFGVDLATRTGTQFPGSAAAGWLRPGQSLEVAGRRIELRELWIDGQRVLPEEAERSNPLTQSGDVPLVRVTLFPIGSSEAPWTLNSELVFLGRSASCGVRVDADTAARIHCVVVRTPDGAFVVDLSGRGTIVNGRAITEAGALADNDTLEIGAARFEVQIRPPDTIDYRASLPARQTPRLVPDLFSGGSADLPAGQGPSESQAAMLAWTMGILQAAQTEMLRGQEAFRREIVHAFRELQQEQMKLVREELEAFRNLGRELEQLRTELATTVQAPRPAPMRAPAPQPRPQPRGNGHSQPPGVANPAASRPQVPTPNGASPGSAAQDVETLHALIVQRIATLQDERQTRWQKILDTMLGR